MHTMVDFGLGLAAVIFLMVPLGFIAESCVGIVAEAKRLSARRALPASTDEPSSSVANVMASPATPGRTAP